MSLVAAIRTALAPSGLNLVAVTPVERYDREVPEAFRLRKRYPAARSVIVIGNGGGALWAALEQRREAHPDEWEVPDPIDTFTVNTVEAVMVPLLSARGLRGRFVYPFRFEHDPVSFMHLGEIAGLGRRSLLGVLVHPEYGPWLALRAAVLLDAEIAPTAVEAFDPCGTCAEKPCMSACPASAVNGHGWDIPRCTAYRLQPPGHCGDGCAARLRCVYGRAHSYPLAALAYHQQRALAAMQARHGA